MASQQAGFGGSIIATLREPFLVLDKQLRIQSANRAFYEKFQAVEGETEGRLLRELGNGQWNSARLLNLLENVLEGEHPVHDFAIEHDFPTIGCKHMLLNASPFRDSERRAEMILLAIEDVTARKSAEAALQASELRYRRLFETAKDGILILDARELRVIDANPFMTELLGFSHAELLGKELWEIGFFADKTESQAAYRDLRADGYLRYEHLPLETKSGFRAEVEFVCNTYEVEGREVAQCNIRDISERMRLERRGAEQATALADLHRRKDEFLAMLSHELRNPLAPIANAVQLLRLGQDHDPLQQQARAIIDRQVTQLTRLVDDLMEVSRVTTGRIQLRLEPVLANAIVERAVETARPAIDRHLHNLELSLSPEPIWLHADPSRLEQVIVNLLTNAAKYTADGGRIALAVEQRDGECTLRIRDTGVGIAPDLLPRIFDLFTQAERSLDRSQGGLGIGLAVVQRLVELHGGRVGAYSALGQGSEFVVHLPVVVPAVLAPVASPPGAGADPAPVALRVLVVDDNLDSAQSFAMLLRKAGHSVRMAHTGPEAVDATRVFAPQALLLDLGLPGLDGYAVAERIRQLPGHRQTLLIAMTGYGQESDRLRSGAAGFAHHLVKPVDFRAVQEILAKVETDGLLETPAVGAD
jgi:PAS domain S-box-containing protein